LRILFINQYYAPDFAATAQLLADLCTGLVARGHEVHVLASRAIYDGRKLDLPAEEVLDGVHVHRIEIGSSRRGRYRERLEGYVSFLSRAFAKVHALPRYDVVVTLTTPPFLSLIGIWLRLVRRSRFVYWVMDIYPDIALRAGVLRTFGPVRLAWSLLGRISYLGANRVVALGDSMRAVLSRKGIADEKLSVVPCWSGGDEVRPVEHEANAFRREHFRPDDFVVMYSGNAGTCHHFRSVIDCIRSLKESPSIKFVFVGGGKRIPQIQTELSGVRNVKFLPYQPRESLAESLSAADVHLVTLEPAFDGLMIPSKIYGAMAANRPLLFVGSATNDIAKLIRENGCGDAVVVDDAEALATTIKGLAEDRDRTSAMGARGGKHFRASFDRPIVVEQFARLLEQIADEKGIRGHRRPAHRVELSPVGELRESESRR
jgi:colanic acid biosynthesis glycosyl transferase WcaI